MKLLSTTTSQDNKEHKSSFIYFMWLLVKLNMHELLKKTANDLTCKFTIIRFLFPQKLKIKRSLNKQKIVYLFSEQLWHINECQYVSE